MADDTTVRQEHRIGAVDVSDSAANPGGAV
jgi:hypothetical protein